MKLGANNRKEVVALGILVVVGGYLFYTNVLAGPSVPSARTSAPPPSADATSIAEAPVPGSQSPGPKARSSATRSDEFHPVLHSKRPEDRIDPVKIDPTLRLDLLAKLQEVGLPTGGRNPFKMGAPPPPKAAELKGPDPKVPLKPVKADEKAAPSGPAPPPPITLKYYGFTYPVGAAAKTAFFLDGDDILVAKEGDTLKKRYRVVRIGVNSVVMEDTDSKRQQTLPLAEEAG